MDVRALFKLSYGLFVLTARENGKDNGCIINTAIQCASDPLQMSVCVINKNYTCDLIKASGRFNVSVIPQSAPFKVFQVFGHQSGRNVDKFAECTQDLRLDNGIRYLPKANAVFACRVIESHDIGSHTVFIAEVEDARTLTDVCPCVVRFAPIRLSKAQLASVHSVDENMDLAAVGDCVAFYRRLLEQYER